VLARALLKEEIKMIDSKWHENYLRVYLRLSLRIEDLGDTDFKKVVEEQMKNSEARLQMRICQSYDQGIEELAGLVEFLIERNSADEQIKETK
jgi:hypothetical protein